MSTTTQEKQKEYNKRYYEKHRDEVRLKQKEAYMANRENYLAAQKIRSKKYYEKNKDEILERIRFRITNNVNGVRDRKLLQARERWRRDRDTMFNALGGARCGCGFNDIRALEIDHIKRGGKEHRSTFSNSAYRDYVVMHPQEFQVLCSNCHSIKTYLEMDYGKTATEPDTNRR